MTATRMVHAPTAEAPIPRKLRDRLLRQMYSLKHWIELIRRIGYQTLPLDQARKDVQSLADAYGQEPMAEAWKDLLEVLNPDAEATVRLKPHVRRMAIQILGFEKPDATPVAVNANGSSSSLPSETAEKPSHPPQSKPSRRPKEPKTTPLKRIRAKTSKGSDPMMAPYLSAKEKHPGMLLLFRRGDFYELFGDDAETACRLLGLTLTKGNGEMPMTGFPHHQLEAYLGKLLRHGQRVAVCDPVENGPVPVDVRPEVPRVDMSEQKSGRRVSRDARCIRSTSRPRQS